MSFVDKLESVAVTGAKGFNTLRKIVFPTILALIVRRVVSKPKTHSRDSRC